MAFQSKFGLLCAALFLLAAVPAPAGPPPPPAQTYVALGDSVAFGYTTAQDTVASVGDQGYVAPYADWLGTQNGGARPRVVNLAVPGETWKSFFHAGQFGELLNLNYAAAKVHTQNALLLRTLSAERKAHRAVTTVTVQLGANDLRALITPAFLRESAAAQGKQMHAALVKLSASELRLLGLLHARLPGAHVTVLGYYNPLAALPMDPNAPAFQTYLPQLNGTLLAGAARFHDRFVDLSVPFAGHEGEWTFITQLGYPDGIHPNAAGYAAIAGALEQ